MGRLFEYDVFVSYCSKDREVVGELVERFGKKVFFLWDDV